MTLPHKPRRLFLIAIQKNDLSQVESLVRSGVDVETPIQKGLTALALAASRNQYDLVDLLLNYGANPHFLDRFARTIMNLFVHHTRTPLDFRIAQRLVGAGVNPYEKLWMNEWSNIESPLGVLLKKQKTPEVFIQWINDFPAEKYVESIAQKKYASQIFFAGMLWHDKGLLFKAREECQKMGCLESFLLSSDARRELISRCVYRDDILLLRDLQSVNIITSETRRDIVRHSISIDHPYRISASWAWMVIQCGASNIFEEMVNDMKTQLQSEWNMHSVDLVASLCGYMTCRQFEMLRRLGLDISMGDDKGNTLAHYYAASGLMGKTFVRWAFRYGLTGMFEQKNAEGKTVWNTPYRYQNLKNAPVKHAKIKALKAYAESIELRQYMKKTASGAKKLPLAPGMRL